jgi:hypothetical protein
MLENRRPRTGFQIYSDDFAKKSVFVPRVTSAARNAVHFTLDTPGRSACERRDQDNADDAR